MPSVDSDIERRLQAVAGQLFPGITAPRVVDVVRLSGGWECDVYSFVREGGSDPSVDRERLILRVYQGNQAAQKATNEFDVMRLLEATGYPVPRVLAINLNTSPFDRPFVIMEHIDGSTLGTSIATASGEERRALLRRFGRLVVDLHALDATAVAPQLVDGDVARSIDRWLARIEAILSQFPTDAFAPALSWIHDYRVQVTSTRVSIIHQDFHPWNVLLDSTDTARVIDWTQADVSDFRLDLAWTLLLLRTSFDRATRDDFLDEYERLVDHPIEDLPFFEAIAAMKRLASIYLAITFGAESVGMRPGMEANILSERHHLLTARAVLKESTGLVLPAIEDLHALSSRILE